MRSRSFVDEVTALAWAEGYVRDAGDAARALVTRKEYDDEPPRDHEYASHQVAFADGELLVRSWPEESKEDADERVRRALDRASSGRGPVNEGPEWVLARERPFRLLP